MASDNHANYGRIGFTVFFGMFAIAIALIKLAGVGDRSRELLVETYYDYPVSGLSVGSAVNFRGVKIGEVRDINFVYALYPDAEVCSNDFQRVVIVMALDTSRIDFAEDGYRPSDIIDGLIKAGLRATIASNAVTGMSRVEFNIPENPKPPAELVWKPHHQLIPPHPSLMENLSVSLGKALQQINRTDFRSVWSNVASVAESSAKVTRNVSELIEHERDGMSAIVQNMAKTTESVDQLAETLKNNPSLLLRENDPEPLPETR